MIKIRDISKQFKIKNNIVKALSNINLEILERDCFAIVGESGSGKSVTAKSIMQLNPVNTIYNDNAEIIIDDENVLKFTSKHDLKKIRGGKVSMIFQEPMASFAPAIKINFYIKHFKKYFSGRNIFIAREMTKKYETYYRQSIDKLTLFKTQLKGELTIIISKKIRNRFIKQFYHRFKPI